MFVPTNVAEEPSGKMEKSSKNSGISFVSAVAEAAFRLRRIAEPRPVGDRVKAAIDRAAKRVGLPTQRVENLWYGEARIVKAEEMDAIRRADDARQAKEQSAREQAAELGSLFAGVAERLRQIDPDFYRDNVAALLDAAGALGAVDRAVAGANGEER
jgi:hypothetical protein